MQDEVLIAGFGRRGHAVGDIPGVRFKVRLLSFSHSLYCCASLVDSYCCCALLYAATSKTSCDKCAGGQGGRRWSIRAVPREKGEAEELRGFLPSICMYTIIRRVNLSNISNTHNASHLLSLRA